MSSTVVTEQPLCCTYWSAHKIAGRYAVFLTMEVLFTALAWYCYSRPLPLPQYVNVQLNTAKSGFVAIFTVWHTIAIAFAWHICAESFSMEWAAQTHEKPTDAVSTVTSGILDHILFAIIPSNKATKTFRVAVFTFLSMILLRATGSAAITATDGIGTTQPLPIGRIDTSSINPDSTNFGDSVFMSRLAQTNMVVRLELLDAPWGYVPQPNWLIPLPAQRLNMTSRLEYETDLVGFRYQCRWQAPTPDMFSNDTVMIDNERWTGNFLSNARASGINFQSLNTRAGPSIVPLRPLLNYTTGVSAFLFLGRNESMPINPFNLSVAYLDLTGLPVMFNQDIFASSFPTSPINVWAPLATILICDPQLTFTSGTVLLNVQTNVTIPDVTIRSFNPTRSPGNIDPPAARTLFTYALFPVTAGADPGSLALDGTFQVEATDYINFNTVARTIFLQTPLPPRDWLTSGGIRPFNTTVIEEHIDKYTLSALKVFTSGFTGDPDVRQANSVSATVVHAQYTVTRLALVTTLHFGILHTVLFTMIAILLAVLARLNRTQGRVPFDLKHIKEKEKEGLLKNE